LGATERRSARAIEALPGGLNQSKGQGMNQETPSSSDILFTDSEEPSNPVRRKLLTTAVTGLAAGGVLCAPILSDAFSVFAAENAPRKILIAYFSRTGNTRHVANRIQPRVGGDVFELRTVHTYPQEYRATTEQAKREQETGFRPRLTAEVQNMAEYDTVFIGYPNWWGTLPMAFFTFLEKYDFSGKTLIPFCTHEGSRLGRGVADIRTLCPSSKILEGIALRGGSVRSDSAEREVAEWLRKPGMTA
jgi:flavodoxin